MFDDFDTQIHPEETNESYQYELERPEETSKEELASDLEWDAHWLCG